MLKYVVLIITQFFFSLYFADIYKLISLFYIFQVIIGDNYTLQREFLLKLACLGEGTAAIKFAAEFNIEKNDWPDLLKTMSFYDR